MSDLALADPPEALPALLEGDFAAARDFAAAASSAATRRAYKSDWAIFAGYCEARGLMALPAATDTVCAFLAAEAQGGAKAATLGRRVAAIRHAHRLAGHEPPTASEVVKAVMNGIRRSIGTAPVRKAAATADLVRAMLDACPTTLKGRRDRALIALGFAGAFRRSELVALEVQDLIEVPDGYRIRIVRSKTDQEGHGAEVAIPRGAKLRPIECVQAWLAAAGIVSGPGSRHRTGRIARFVARTVNAG